MKVVLLICLVAGLAACATHPLDGVNLDDKKYNSFLATQSERRLDAYNHLANTDDADIGQLIQEKLSDRTYMYLQDGHGIYLEYTAADGQLFMWYPYNGGVVKGTWDVVDMSDGPRACYQYRGAYHGVTGEYEPNECIDAGQTLSSMNVLDYRDGDPFNLSSGHIPYPKSDKNIPRWPDEVEALEEE